MSIECVAALYAAIGGCASVSRPTTKTISVATTPSGAGATVSGLEQPFVCTTPCALDHKPNPVIVTLKPNALPPPPPKPRRQKVPPRPTS